MKKIYNLVLIMLFAFAANAQVNVTYQVDVTEYIAAGGEVAAAGIRVGGDFGAQSGASNGNSMLDWTPSDANSAMTDMGNNVWSITVTYPGPGATQLYKFVNGDWGMNEGTDEGSTIAIDNCGIDDGAGNINRTLEIPAEDVTIAVCWDKCAACQTVSVEELSTIDNIVIAPNPMTESAIVTFDNANGVAHAVTLTSITGQTVRAYNEVAGNTLTIERAGLSAGIYFLTFQNELGEVGAQKLIIQ